MNVQILIVLLALSSISTFANARLKLVAVPERAESTLGMEHPQLTLITERRNLQLQKGLNKIDFSWKGVALDADTIRLEFPGSGSKVSLLNVSYPPNEDALIWEVFSKKATTQSANVSYVLSKIDKQFHYEGQLDKYEKTMVLAQHAVIRNFSGESFVGSHLAFGVGNAVITDTQDGETKRMMIAEHAGVPLKKIYVFDAAVTPWEPDKSTHDVSLPMYYQWYNDEKHRLGSATLAQGKLRIYQAQGDNNTIFNGEDTLSSTPVGKEVRVYISDTRDLKITQRMLSNNRINETKNRKGYVVMWDEEARYEVEIESFKKQSAMLELREPMQGEWEIAENSHPFAVESASVVVFKLDVPAGEKQKLTFNVKRSNVR